MTTSTLRLLLLAAALAVAPIAAHAADPKADASALVEEGKALFRSRDYPAAFAKFRAAADLDRTHPTALYNAALAARKGGLLEEARGAYVDLLELHKDDLDAVYGLAETQRALAHFDEARALYERYVREEKRPERAELVEKSKAELAALPTDVPKLATPALDRASGPPDAASKRAKAAAQELFDEGLALGRLLRHEDAAARFFAAVEKDPSRLDALLKAALMLRKHNALDPSKAAYERVMTATPPPPPEQLLDATYGLAETQRLRGDKASASELFQRYADNEQRASEERYVRRARELAALLREPGAAVAVVPVPVPVPSVGLPALPVVVPPVPIIVPVPAPPVVAVAPPVVAPVIVPTVVTPETAPVVPVVEPKLAAIEPPVVEPQPAAIEPPVVEPTLAAIDPPVVAPPAVEPALAVVEPVAPPAIPAPEPPPLLFFGDALVVDQLIERARAADAADAKETSGALWARARSLAPGDPRLPSATSSSAACDVERQLAVGEVALANQNPGDAIAAFRRARVCDPRRAAPLWGLSRAFDEVGAKKQAKHHAHLYARSSAPDRDPTSTSKAAWRAEQPD